MGRRIQPLTSLREAAHNLIPATANSASARTIGVRNIKVRQRTILAEMSSLAATCSNLNSCQHESISSKIHKTVSAIETICTQTNVTPANLTSSSRQVYTWMKFLTYPGKVDLHHNATYRIQQMGQNVLASHRESWGVSHCPSWHKIVTEVTNIAGLYRVKYTRDTVILTVSEGFINASDDVIMALVENSLIKRDKKTTKIICDFAYSEEYRQILQELDTIIEVIAENPRGKHYDLDYLFTKINREYFAANLVKPRLMWSPIATYRKLGHYEPARDRIVMSLALDDACVPAYVVEFVLYHELLHKLHGTKLVNGRRMIHTPEFRRDEQKFKQYREAELWLQKVAAGVIDED